MKHFPLMKTIFCFALLIFCAWNSSYAINSNVLDSAKTQTPVFSILNTSQQSYLKEQKVLKAETCKEEKVTSRSDRYIKKFVQRSNKVRRPGNGKQTGWFIFWTILGIGMAVSAAFFGVIYGFLLSEGESGTGWVLGGAIVSAIIFGLISDKLIRWNKKFPRNSVRS